jgi:hypothetical protein
VEQVCTDTHWGTDTDTGGWTSSNPGDTGTPVDTPTGAPTAPSDSSARLTLVAPMGIGRTSIEVADESAVYTVDCGDTAPGEETGDSGGGGSGRPDRRVQRDLADRAEPIDCGPQ